MLDSSWLPSGPLLLALFLVLAVYFLPLQRTGSSLAASSVPAASPPAHHGSQLTVQLPLERYGVPGEVDEQGVFKMVLPPEITRVYFEVGLFSNPLYCELPASQPDTFVFAWEANEASWALHHDKCLAASGGKYVALPFAAADSEAPLVWNSAAAQDPCASVAGGAGAGSPPEGWIADPVRRAMKRCLDIEALGAPMLLWDTPLSHDKMVAQVPAMIGACGACKGGHAPGVNRRVRVPVLPFEAILLALPQHIEVEMVKIDAQGADLSVLLSARSQVHRIREVLLEAQDLPVNDPDMLYGGPLVSNVQGIVQKMQELGFTSHTKEVNNCACAEYNLHFYR